MASWLDELGLNELEHTRMAQVPSPRSSTQSTQRRISSGSWLRSTSGPTWDARLRAERIAGEMPAGLSAPAVRYLLDKLPIVDRLASQLPR